MTNKIYLSINRLYTLKDGDYHGAKLSYRIKHGDQVIAEGEREGKSLSLFINPITIEEMEITKPLNVEYVCTGNVEDVSVSKHLPTQKSFSSRAVPILDVPGFRMNQSGEVFISSASIRPGIITQDLIQLAKDADLIGWTLPKIGVHQADVGLQAKVEKIVGRYLSGEASEYADEMVDELMLILEPPNSLDAQNESDRLKTFVNETVAEQVQKMLRPGGLLHRK